MLAALPVETAVLLLQLKEEVLDLVEQTELPASWDLETAMLEEFLSYHMDGEPPRHVDGVESGGPCQGGHVDDSFGELPSCVFDDSRGWWPFCCHNVVRYL